MRSSTEHLTVLLHTDSTGGGRGFLATFNKYYKGTPLEGITLFNDRDLHTRVCIITFATKPFKNGLIVFM